MLRADLEPHLLDEQQCKEHATRQVLSFITLPDTKEGDPPDVRPAPGAPSFSLEDLPDEAFSGGRELFNWKSRDIYDVDGLLLFRDLTLDIGRGRELHVRTAASDLLQTQVWCKCFKGPFAPGDKALIENALKELRRYPDLEPFIVDEEENVRLVAYNHPDTGVLCYSRRDPHKRFVSKLGELLIIPIEPSQPPENPESLFAVWSPYDTVGRHSVAHLRGVWEQNLALLPPLPKNREVLPDKIREARKSVMDERVILEVPFVSQETPKTCAVASALMLLSHHGITRKRLEDLGATYAVIATNMKCDINNGAAPKDQVIEVNRLLALAGSQLKAEPDTTPTFAKARDELTARRPLKIGDGHARVAAGFKELGGQDWLWIYDPLPENQGRKCCVPWTESTPRDFMYVRLPKPPA